MDNFDLRKYLAENRLLKEKVGNHFGGYVDRRPEEEVLSALQMFQNDLDDHDRTNIRVNALYDMILQDIKSKNLKTDQEILDYLEDIENNLNFNGKRELEGFIDFMDTNGAISYVKADDLTDPLQENTNFDLRKYLAENRLLKEERDILVEQVINEALLEEGWKELALAAMMLITPSLSDAQIINKANELSKDKIELSTTIKTAAEILSKKNNISFSRALRMVERNAKDLKKAKEKGDKISSLTAKTKGKVAALIQYQGYSLTEVTVDTIQNEIEAQGGQIKYDTLVTTVPASNFFKAGEYQLSSEGASKIINAIKELKKQDFRVINVGVKSSTDKQRVSESTLVKLRNAENQISPELSNIENKIAVIGDASNIETRGAANELLSKLRASEVKDLLVDLGIPSDQIVLAAVWNQGSGEDNAPTEQDASKRYVSVVITSIKVPPPTDEVKPGENFVETVVTYYLEKGQEKSKDFDFTIPPIIKLNGNGIEPTKTDTYKCVMVGKGKAIQTPMGRLK